MMGVTVKPCRSTDSSTTSPQLPKGVHRLEVSFERIRKSTAKGPQFRILFGDVEIGAAWEKHSEQTGRDYLFVKIDDPSMMVPIRATLVEAPGKGVFHLTWFRISKGD